MEAGTLARHRDLKDLALVGLWREEPHAHGPCNDALAKSDEQRVMPQEAEERVREPAVHHIARRRAPPATQAAKGRVLLAIHLLLPSEALGPLAVARPWLRAVACGFQLRPKGRCRHVVAGHVGEYKGRGTNPEGDPNNAHHQLRQGHAQDLRGLRHELRGHLAHGDGQLDAGAQAAEQQAPNHAKTDQDEAQDLKDLACQVAPNGIPTLTGAQRPIRLLLDLLPEALHQVRHLQERISSTLHGTNEQEEARREQQEQNRQQGAPHRGLREEAEQHQKHEADDDRLEDDHHRDVPGLEQVSQCCEGVSVQAF
mmetsp:Transcript_88262/g.285100  ORF Transcript_88262/g.285100 Transcript_88262/m.285100 type:complete len:312 (+) Transcript_88262:849-1784(+)